MVWLSRLAQSILLTIIRSWFRMVFLTSQLSMSWKQKEMLLLKMLSSYSYFRSFAKVYDLLFSLFFSKQNIPFWENMNLPFCQWKRKKSRKCVFLWFKFGVCLELLQDIIFFVITIGYDICKYAWFYSLVLFCFVSDLRSAGRKLTVCIICLCSKRVHAMRNFLSDEYGSHEQINLEINSLDNLCEK